LERFAVVHNYLIILLKSELFIVILTFISKNYKGKRRELFMSDNENKDISEFKKLKDTINTYIEGSRELNYEKMISVVHPDARLFLGNVETSKKLYEHWKPDPVRFPDEKSKKEWYNKAIIKILSIQIEGTIASVKLQFANWYYDFHNFVKINGEWKMVDKVSSKIEHHER